MTHERLARILVVFICTMGGWGCQPRPSKLGDAAGGAEHAATIELLMGGELRAARAIGAGETRLGLAGTGIPGDSLGGVVDLAEGDCALVLGRGTVGVQDVDVFAFADDGTVLASDESPAKDATVLLCPPLPSRIFVSGRVATGFGLFGVAAQILAPGQAGTVGRHFGITSSRPTRARELDSNWPGLDELLAEHRRRLGGDWESLRKVALPLDPRVYVNVSTIVDADRCIDLLVSPSDEVAHVELEILEANGRWIGSGQARGVDRNLMVCSSEQRELTIRCRPHAGRGLAALVISRSALGAPHQLPANTARFDLRPAGDLVQLRQENAAQLEASGYGAATLVHEGSLQPERRISLPLPLTRGCSRVDILTAAPLRSLHAWLRDGSGQLLSEDARGMSATLFTCGSALSGRLDLETAARGGPFLVEVRRSAAVPEVSERHRLAMGRLLGLMDAHGRLPSLDALPLIREARVSEHGLARFSLPLTAGSCLELSAALDRGTSGLEVRLFDDAKSMTTEVPFDASELGYGAHAASARFCAVKPATSRVLTAELRANVGEGTALWASYGFDPEPSAKGPRAR